MISVTDIKHRIKVVTQTRQVTRAMYLIASAKMKKSLERYNANDVYFKRVRQTIKYIIAHSGDEEHYYFSQNLSGEEAGCVVIASDRGLVGGYNSAILHLADERVDSMRCRVYPVGQIANEHYRARGAKVDDMFAHYIHDPQLYQARKMSNELCHQFRHHLTELFVGFTLMDSAVKQTPHFTRILPLKVSDFDDVPLPDDTEVLDYLPSAKEVLDVLVPQYVVGLLYAMLVQSYASEQSSRMSAMSDSTRNADEMLVKYGLQMNRARQDAITQEISEIIGAAEALSDT